MKIINRYISNVFKLQKRHPNSVRYLMQQIPDSVKISSKELKTQKFKSPITALLSSFIKETKNLSNEHFIIDSYNFSKKAYRISDDIAPPLCFMENLGANDAAYIFCKNMIAVSPPKFSKFENSVKLSLVTHESRHATQLYDGLRIESNLDNSVEKLAELSLKEDRFTLLESVKYLDFEEIDELKNNGTFDEKLHNLYIMAKTYPSGNNNNTKEMVLLKEKILNEIKKEHTSMFKDEFVNAWKTIQSKIIEESGIIKSNTKKASKAGKLFESLLDSKEIGTEEYFKSIHEKDAYFVCKYLHDLYLAVRANNVKNFF